MPVAINSVSRIQQPVEKAVDPLDQILKGLQIASSIYGIKHGIDQNDLSKLQQTKVQQDITAQEALQKTQGEDLAMMKDPKSPFSQTSRAYAKKYVGTEPTENISGYDLRNIIDPKKLIETEASGKIGLEKEGAKATIQEKVQKAKFAQEEKLVGLKAQTAETKGDKTLEIPGYQISPDVKPSTVEARNLRTAVSESKTLNDLINRTADLASKASVTDLANPMSDVRNQIQNNLKQAQLLYKGPSFAQLGVLAGPDMAILDSIIENPITYSSLAKGTEGVVSRLKDLTTNINANVRNKLEVSGYLPKGESTQQTAGPANISMDEIQKEKIRRQGLTGAR